MENEETWIAKELRRQEEAGKKMSGREFARQTGCSPTHAHKLITGAQRPSPKLCRRIARVFGVTEQEVMRQAGHLSPLPDGYSELDEQRLVELYRSLSHDGRNQLMRFAEFLRG